ncbi:DUF2799 domain-containing protein [Psychrobacter lutiphocae]|uniref:DUF2799 domain-containing protein n=1 Tax=Psychrobacter lutiphocae TaxID=540500 RepID=UPI0003623AFE|nr:DUF2799 domain-containing protein [Psychrobacter lutiphocae]
MTDLRIAFANSALVGAIILLSGCATTQALSPEQCQAGNWKEIGYADGTVGRSGDFFGKHLQSCSQISGSTPNRMLWEEGRQEGLKEYCTELNAYKLGREGYAWQPVCPMENIEKLEEAYDQGRYYYLRQRDLEYLTTPYPWGYGGRFGRHGYGPYRYYSPFWYPY